MHLLDRYHLIVHDIAALFGYEYGDAVPSWAHPFIHLILVAMPVMLVGALIYLVLRWGLAYRSRPPRGPEVQAPIRGLDPSLVRMVLRHSRHRQALTILLSLLAMPILYVTLELPKQIVNNALEAERFPVAILGFQLDQVALLALLCLTYLVAIILNGLNKYTLNVLKGDLAERFLRRLRLLVYRQWRRAGARNRQSEIIPILAQEVEPIGGFAADVLTLPILQGGTLATILLFMFVQDPLLGAAALTVLPVQILLLPNLQQKVNALSRLRIREVRLMGRQLGEEFSLERPAADGLRRGARGFRELEQIRRRIFRLKYFLKALNNFLTALTPFLFYSLGGYFVLEGRISLGALVAVLAAHKDFSAPLRELFRYYQMSADSRVRYQEVNAFFSSEGEVEATTLPLSPRRTSVPLRRINTAMEGRQIV
ncbi:ABC transporter ATP-binding protein [Sulfitobacter aestuarii]|uniref:ABC transporter ATP-binding protein n=1 Tax=Sulfitobacter aestuarii TaxID=2161676 RepID=A0ABW5TXW7_9RHOB